MFLLKVIKFEFFSNGKLYCVKCSGNIPDYLGSRGSVTSYLHGLQFNVVPEHKYRLYITNDYRCDEEYVTTKDLYHEIGRIYSNSIVHIRRIDWEEIS